MKVDPRLERWRLVSGPYASPLQADYGAFHLPGPCGANPPKSQWINNHPFCLHLWRPLRDNIPLPPQIAVGLKELNLSHA